MLFTAKNAYGVFAEKALAKICFLPQKTLMAFLLKKHWQKYAFYRKKRLWRFC